MANYNLIKNGKIVNTIVADAAYIATIQSNYDSIELVPDPVVEPPAVVPPADPVPPKVSPVEFKLLFTPAERIAINTARASDAALEDFFSIIDDPRLSVVDLNLQSTKNGLDYLISKGLITTNRKTAILTGVIL